MKKFFILASILALANCATTQGFKVTYTEASFQVPGVMKNDLLARCYSLSGGSTIQTDGTTVTLRDLARDGLYVYVITCQDESVTVRGFLDSSVQSFVNPSFYKDRISAKVKKIVEFLKTGDASSW